MGVFGQNEAGSPLGAIDPLKIFDFSGMGFYDYSGFHVTEPSPVEKLRHSNQQHLLFDVLISIRVWTSQGVVNGVQLFLDLGSVE